jgi:DNA polymerase III delta subunit
MQLIAELDLPMVMMIEPLGIMQILMVQFLTLILMTSIYRSNNPQNQIVDVL